MEPPRYSIAAVERDLALSKDVLRAWERRYGFPTPERDAHGERLYPQDQVERLRLVKRLMAQGHRPGRLLALSGDELAALAAAPRGASTRSPTVSAEPPEAADELAPILELVGRASPADLERALRHRLASGGLRSFVQDTIAPMTRSVGLAWEQARLRIFEEHLFTETSARVLRQAIAAVPGGTAPRVLLTTLPGEQHALGLLMVEAMLSLEGARCVSLGTQTPPGEIVGAAAAHRADVVALSFSAAFPARQIAPALATLRAALPPKTGLWVGGQGVMRGALPDGVQRLLGLDDAVAAAAAWRPRN